MSTRPLRGLDLPRSDGARHPARYLLHGPVRSLAAAALRRRFDLRVTGAGNVPSRGPVIVAGNHIGLIDGPLLAIVGPRPVHALTKEEMFRGRTGAFLAHSGQISIDRFHADPGAVKACLRVLRAGNAVGIFPEGTRGDGTLARFHRGAAYLALVSGAPVVPVTFLGTREPGGHIDSVPPKGARIEVVFGEPFPVAQQPWPRTREQVDTVSRLLREHMLVQLDRARASTGLELPGPLPLNEMEPDPATGITDDAAGPASNEESHD